MLTDQDKAFLSKPFQELLQKEDIHFYTSRDDAVKAAHCERVIRTIKSKISKFLTAYNTFRYLEALPFIVANYNKTYHRSIKMAPKDVKFSDHEKLLARLYPPPAIIKPPKFKAGDQVRISLRKHAFGKEGARQFSTEIFTVYRTKGRHQPYRWIC